MNLSALQLDERRSATGIRSWSVRSSLDGFASDIALFTVPDDILIRTETAQLPTQFKNLTTPVEFRIFGFQAEAAGGTWRIDNVTLIGGIAPTCGNAVLDPGEQCDDGHQAAGDGCSPACRLEVCGNAVLDPGEQCDDGNQATGDGCSPACRFEVCGNGIVDPGEQCDDGNPANGDGCDNTCVITAITYIKASNTGGNDVFGGHVALSADGSTLAIAASAEDSAATGINGNQADNTTRNAGAVYVFTRNGTTWQQQAYIKASNTGANDIFGFSVALTAGALDDRTGRWVRSTQAHRVAAGRIARSRRTPPPADLAIDRPQGRATSPRAGQRRWSALADERRRARWGWADAERGPAIADDVVREWRAPDRSRAIDRHTIEGRRAVRVRGAAV